VIWDTVGDSIGQLKISVVNNNNPRRFKSMARRGKVKATRLFIGKSSGGNTTEVTATAAELNSLDNVWASIATSTTPASGTCAIALTFSDANGDVMATPVAGTLYVSDLATGLEVDVLDTGMTASVGVVTIVDTGVTSHYNFVTTAAGLLTVTITSGADSHWLCFTAPNGGLVISDECVINA
jgi:hypothetical protein